MKRLRAESGYTILETMIFLVVTAFLLVAAFGIFRGQGQRTAFTQGVRELNSSLQDAYNQTASGYYPNNGNFSCTASGTGPVPDTTANKLGTNTQCIFLGRVFQFAPSSDPHCSATTNYSCYNLYAVIGQRTVSAAANSANVSTLTEAKPTAVVPNGIHTTYPDLTQYSLVPSGLRVYALRAYKAGAAAPNTVGGFGFINAFANSSSNSDLGGAQTVDLVPIYGAGSNVNKTVDTFAPLIGNMQEGNRNPDLLILCISDGTGTTARRAAITLGGKTSGSDSSRKYVSDVAIDNVPSECPTP